MGILESSGFELIANPDDAAPPRQWVLDHLKNPEVVAACIMHSQPGDKVDQEFIDSCNENLKVVSTFSVGYGGFAFLGFFDARSHQRQSCSCSGYQDRAYPWCLV